MKRLLLIFALCAQAWAQYPTHIVWIIKENRSFDQMFGHFPGVAGYPVTTGQHAASVNAPCPGALVTGTCTVTLYHANPKFSDADCNHYRSGSLAEYNSGAMNGFNNGNAGSLNYTGNNSVTSGVYGKPCYVYYDGGDLTFYYTLAAYYSLADNSFASMNGPSYPNHAYIYMGKSQLSNSAANEVADNPDEVPGSTGGTVASWTCKAATANGSGTNAGQPSGGGGTSGGVPNIYITNLGTYPGTAGPTGPFSLTAMSSSGGLTTYTGTITAGDANAYATYLLTVTGFTTTSSNVTTQQIISSTSTTLVVATTTQGASDNTTGSALIGYAVTNDVSQSGAAGNSYATGVCGGHCNGGANVNLFCNSNAACPSSTCTYNGGGPAFPTQCTTANQSTQCTGGTTCEFEITVGRQLGSLCPSTTAHSGSPVVTTMFQNLTANSVTHKWYGATSAQSGYIWVAPAYVEDDIFTNETGNVTSIAQYLTDANQSGSTCNLPSVSYLTPTMAQSDHPAVSNITPAYNVQSVAAGQAWTEQMVNAITQGPCYSTTLIVLDWDDAGGFFDHVAPPQIDNVGLGMRVPMILIGPYVKRGINHTQFEFGSVVKYIEDTFLPTGCSGSVCRLSPRDTNANSISVMINTSQSPIPPPHPAPVPILAKQLNDPDLVTLVKDVKHWLFPKRRDVDEAFIPKLSPAKPCTEDGFRPAKEVFGQYPVSAVTGKPMTHMCAKYEGKVYGQDSWVIEAMGQTYQDQDDVDK